MHCYLKKPYRFAIISAMALSACGGDSSDSGSSDDTNINVDINSLESLAENFPDGIWRVQHQFEGSSTTNNITTHSAGNAWSTVSVSTFAGEKRYAICGFEPSPIKPFSPLFITGGFLVWDFAKDYQVSVNGSEIRIIEDDDNQLVFRRVSSGSMSHGSVSVLTSNSASGIEEPADACLYIRDITITTSANNTTNTVYNTTYSVNFPNNGSYSQLTLTLLQDNPTTGTFSLNSPPEASVTAQGEGFEGNFIDCNLYPADTTASVTFSHADYKSVAATFNCSDDWGDGVFSVSGSMNATLPE